MFIVVLYVWHSFYSAWRKLWNNTRVKIHMLFYEMYIVLIVWHTFYSARRKWRNNARVKIHWLFFNEMHAIIQHTCSLYNIYCLCYWTLNHLVHIIIWLWYSGRKYDDMREYMEFKMFIVSNQLSLVIKNWNFKQALLTISLYFNQGQLFINTFSFLTFSTFIHFIFLFFFFGYNFLFFQN